MVGREASSSSIMNFTRGVRGTKIIRIEVVTELIEIGIETSTKASSTDIELIKT